MPQPAAGSATLASKLIEGLARVGGLWGTVVSTLALTALANLGLLSMMWFFDGPGYAKRPFGGLGFLVFSPLMGAVVFPPIFLAIR